MAFECSECDRSLDCDKDEIFVEVEDNADCLSVFCQKCKEEEKKCKIFSHWYKLSAYDPAENPIAAGDCAEKKRNRQIAFFKKGWGCLPCGSEGIEEFEECCERVTSTVSSIFCENSIVTPTCPSCDEEMCDQMCTLYRLKVC